MKEPRRSARGAANNAVAELLEAAQAGPDWVEARCSHFGPCGGCSLQELSYPAQVEWKRRTLEETLTREGGFSALPPVEVFPMDPPWSYRSKMEFTFGEEEGRVILGLHRRGSFQRIVDIARCEIAPPGVGELLAAIKEAANRSGLRSYHPRIHRGFWRYAVVRCSRSRGELMLLLVTHEGPREALREASEALCARIPALKSVYWGISTKVSDVAEASELVHLAGEEALEDEAAGVRFLMGPRQFIQPNLTLACRVYEEIRRRAELTGGEAVYDLYCGIGLIALSLAREARSVFGVESEQENVAFAQRNAELNGLSNAAFLWGRLEDLLKGRALFRTGPKPDLVVLDPPRAGLHPDVIGPLLESRAPALLYLSCNPATLARDLRVLCARDPRHRVRFVQLFDFFPHTAHSEVLVGLRRAI